MSDTKHNRRKTDFEPISELVALAQWLEMYRPGPLYDLLPPLGEVTGESAAKMLRKLDREKAMRAISNSDHP